MQAFNVSPIPVAPTAIEDQAASPQTGDNDSFAPLLNSTIESQNSSEQNTESQGSEEFFSNQPTPPLDTEEELPAETDFTSFVHIPQTALQILLTQESQIPGQPLLKNGIEVSTHTTKIGFNGEPHDIGLLHSRNEDATKYLKNPATNQFSQNLGNENLATFVGQKTSIQYPANRHQTTSVFVKADILQGSSIAIDKGGITAATSTMPATTAVSSAPTTFTSSPDVTGFTLNKGEALAILESGQIDSSTKQQLERFLGSDDRNSIVIKQHTTAGIQEILPNRIPIHQIETGQATTQQQSTATLPESLLAATLSDKPATTQQNAIRADESLPSLRQSQHGTTIEAKSVFATQRNGNESQQNFMAQGEGSQQEVALATTAKGGAPITSEQTSMFAAPSLGSEPPPTNVLTDTARPVPFTPAIPINEDSIFNQVIRRFQVRTQLRNSNMVLKLHPAELGELRVDIAVKEGSLKANFLAQSHQVQEVLEKQMPKLKEVMAQHGVNVDDINVSLDSDAIDEHGFSQDDFKNDSFDTGSHKRSETRQSFDQSLEQLLSEDEDADTGINVKA